MMKKLASLMLLLCVALLATAQEAEIQIVGPAEIEPGAYNRYDVVGIDEDQLARAELTYTPQENVIVLPAKTWGGKPFLFFMAKSEGTYSIKIQLNVWRKTLKQTIEEATAGNVDDAIVIDLRLIDDEVDTDYPLKLGAIDIKVGEGGDDDDDDDDVDPPTPKPKGPYTIAIFWESSDQSLSKEQLILTSSVDFHEELRKAGNIVRGFDPDQANTLTSDWKTFYDAAKAGGSWPQVAIAPIAGGEVRVFPLPANKEEFLKKLEGK